MYWATSLRLSGDGLAGEDTPLVEVDRVRGGVFEAEIEIEQVGRAGLVAFVEGEGFLRDQAGREFGDVDGLFALDGFVRLVGVGDVFEGFVRAGERADGAGAEAVGPDVLGLAADFEFMLELGEFDAAADVGEREGNLVVFQDDEFLVGRRRRGSTVSSRGGRFRRRRRPGRRAFCSGLPGGLSLRPRPFGSCSE